MIKYPIVITLTGKARSGKDTVAQMVVDWCKKNNKAPFTLAYADQLKNMVSRNFNYSEDNKEEGRHYLQEFGDLVRGIEEDYFVHHVWHTIDLLKNNYDVFVITDTRYENELRPFPYNLMYPIFNVYVDRDTNELGDKEKSHISEHMATNPNLEKFQVTIDNNGTLEDSAKQVEFMMETIFDEMSDNSE